MSVKQILLIKKSQWRGVFFWEGLSTLGRPTTKIPEDICRTRLLLDFKYFYITILINSAARESGTSMTEYILQLTPDFLGSSYKNIHIQVVILSDKYIREFSLRTLSNAPKLTNPSQKKKTVRY